MFSLTKKISLLLLTMIMATSATAVEKILCYGDSITQGTYINGSYKTNISWVNILKSISGGDFECINAGRSSRKTADIAELDQYLDANSKIDSAIYYLGINDLANANASSIAPCIENTTSFIKKVRTKYGQNLPITIVGTSGLSFQTLANRFRNLGFNEDTHKFAIELNKAYQILAKKYKCNFVNLMGVISQENYSDGVHPDMNGQFQTANFLYTKLSKKRQKIRIACVGDSITFGANIPNRDAASYPARLNQLLDNKFIIQNFGLSARTLMKKGDRPYWREAAYNDAKNFFPNVVLIKLGTNDSKTTNWKHQAEFESDLTEFINSFATLPSKPQVILLTPAPMFTTSDTERWEMFPKIVAEEVCPKIKNVAKQLKLQVIDIQTLMPLEKNLFQNDGVHPTADGANKIAEIVAQHIKKQKIGQGGRK
ncbi:MAG: GDSL-type esterase/lipase family protein [Lentisphaeria bacterium]